MTRAAKLRIAAWILGGLLGVVVLLVALLHTPPVRRFALKQAVVILDRQGVRFSAAELQYNLLSLTATLQNVEVRSTRTPDLPPLLTVGTVDVDLRLRRLLGGALYVESATVRDPRIHLVVDKDGRDNIPRGPDSGEPSKETDYLIESALVDGGSVRFEDRRQSLDVTLPLEKITAKGDPSSKSHAVELVTRDGVLGFQGHSLPLKNVRVAAVVHRNAADVSGLDVRFGDSTVRMTGRVDGFADPRLALRAEGTLSLAQLLAFSRTQQTASGNLQFTLAATGPLASLKVDAHVVGTDLTADRLRGVNLKADATYDLARSRVQVGTLNVSAPIGTVRGSADVALTNDAGTTTVNLTATGLDLAQVSALAKSPVSVASRAEATIAARWPGLEFDKAAGEATVALSATRPVAKDRLPVSGRFTVRMRGDTISAEVAELRALDTVVSGDVNLANRKSLGGTLRAESGTLASTIAGAEALLGREPLGVPVDGNASVTATLGGTIDSPTAQAVVAGRQLQLSELKDARLDAQATYDNTGVTIQESDLRWQGQTVRVAGRAGPSLDLTASSQSLKIESVLAGLGQSGIPASGDLTLEARITGTAKAPEADLHITGTGMAAYGEPLGTLDARAQLRGDVLTLSGLRLEKPQTGGAGTLTATGSYNLETKQATLDAHSGDLTLTSLTLPDSFPVRGTLRLDVALRGTLSEPSGTAQIQANGLELDGAKVGAISLNASLANGSADIQADLPAFHVKAQAKAGTKSPYPVTFEMRADEMDLASLPVAQMPLQGSVTALVKGSGEASNWRQGEATVEVAPLSLTYNGQPLGSDGPVSAHYRAGNLIVDRATLTALGSRVQLAGSLPIENKTDTGQIKVSAKLDLATLSHYVPGLEDFTARGTAVIDGTVRGNLQRVDPNLTVGLTDGYLFSPQLNPPLSGIDLQAHVKDGAVELLSATASLGPASFSATGTLPFSLLPADLPVELPRKKGPATFNAELRDVDLSTIKALPEELAGMVSARLEASATQPDLTSVKGTLTFPTLRLNYGTLALEQQGISTVVLADGKARVERLRITGPDTSLTVSGTAELAGKRALDLKVDASADAAIASAFAESVRADGKTELHVSLNGTADKPEARGYLSLADGSLSVREPRLGFEGLDLRVDFAGTQATLSRLDGTLNGGALTGGGTLDLAGGELRSANLTAKAAGVFLDVPEGLKTLSDVELTLRGGRNNTLVLGGQVSIQDGGFTDDLNFDRGLLAAINSDTGIELTADRNPLLERLRFNIGVRTENPLIIDNNLAEAEISADLRVLGDPYQLGLSGRLDIAEGGELVLQERRYVVERGAIVFTSDRRIEPNMDIVATTSASGYDVRLQISGYPGKTESTLTSDPPLPEPDILALLITGKRVEELRGQEFEVARNQVLSYLTGRVGSTLGRGIAGATGLSTVRIEPNLIAAEADPSARLTVGQDITRNIELIYSMDLVNSADQIYVAEYDVTRRFTTRGVRQADGSFRFDFRHDLRFGGTPEPRREARLRDRFIGRVNIVAGEYFSQLKIADRFGVREGNRYDFFKVRKGLDRVNRLYTKAGLLESRVRLRREEQGRAVNINLTVESGPVIDFVFEGASVPDKVRNRVRELWRDGVFDAQRAEEAVEAIRAWLVTEDRLRPQIEYSLSEPSAGRKRVTFDIQPGPQFRDVALEFEGANAIDAETLRQLIAKQKLTAEVYTAPVRVSQLLTAYYRELGYLDCQVSLPRYELNAAKSTGRVVFPVREGALFKVGEVRFEGNTVFTADQLAEDVPLPKGEPFRPVLRQNALQRLRQAYWDIGFNDADAQFIMVRSAERETVDLTFRIEEGRQAIVREVVVEGREHTSESLVLNQVALKAGDILDFQRIAEARRNLYNTGAFSLVEITREDLDGGAQTRLAERPMRLLVRVREIQPWELRYGGFFDTERGPGGIVDLSNRNMLGNARVIGLRTRLDRQLREARLYFSQPMLKRFPLRTIATPYLRQERNPATEDSDPFNVDRKGFSIQQETTWRRIYILNYGYRIEKSRTYDVSEDLLFDVPLRVAGLTATLSRETRDEILGATSGSFMSHGLQYSPEKLGSELRFIKYFGQFFKYFPLQKPRIELFTNEVLRPRLVYATGVRVGLAKGLGGQIIPPSERFFAGGGTTLRGFEQNGLGPISFGRTPGGGNGMLILNNELRFPVVGIFDGVGFVDVGNVYARVSDFSLSDIRKVAGAGLRVRTPWFLLRLDYGLKLDRQPGESRGRFFFSIGQAF